MLDFLKKKPSQENTEPQKQKEQPTQQTIDEGPICMVCQQPGADKKFGGHYFHKKCLKRARKMAKGMM